MLKCRKVAVTGPIASGKSSVCRFLRELGAFTVDADAIVHRLLTPDHFLGQKVIQLLGPDIVRDEQIDRGKIAEKVFTNHELLWKLEQLIHPEVQKEVASLYKEVCSTANYSLFVVEIPLLFETRSNELYDTVIVVEAEEEKSKQRFIERSKYNGEEFARRSARLIPLKQKKELADFVVVNNSSLADLHAQVKDVYLQLVRGNN